MLFSYSIVAVGAFSLWQLAELLLLIHPYIIYEILHRHGGIIYLATIITAQGKIEQEILRLLERLLAIAKLAIHRLILANLVKEFIIQVKTNALLIPIHAPNVELISPLRIPIGKWVKGIALLFHFAVHGLSVPQQALARI